MAEKSFRPPPWSEDNEDEQEFVQEVEKYYNLLIDHFADLRTVVRTSSLWAHLIQLKVIDDSIIEDFTLKKTETAQVEALLFHLLRDTTWRLHAFIRALCLDSQEHVVTKVLNLNHEDYNKSETVESNVSFEEPLPLWSKHNHDQQDIVKQTPKYHRIIKENLPKLKQVIRTKDLWAHLIALDVIETTESEAFKDKKATNQEKVESLLMYLLKSPCWKLHGFLRALAKDKQEVVLRNILKVDPNKYKDKEPHWMNELCPEDLEKLMKAIESHREVYEESLMKGNLFDIPSFDEAYNMKHCYTPIFITSDELQTTSFKIPPEELIDAKQGEPKVKTAVLSGPPGVGKSTLVKHYVYKWSKKDNDYNQWDLIIILDVATLRLDPSKSPMENIKEAIKQSLEGNGDVDTVMKALEETTMKTLLVTEGMDECYDRKTIIDMLTELIKRPFIASTALTVLGTSRSALCPVPYKLFQKRMKIEGFTRNQGLDYIQNFYDNIQRPVDGNIFMNIVANEDKLDHILRSPLCTHIFSIVTSDGTLQVEIGQGIPLKQLFDALEKSMRRRQLENNRIQQGWDPLKINEEEDEQMCEELNKAAMKFYLMSLVSILDNVRTFDKAYLEKFHLTEDHPYYIFLKKEKIRKVNIGRTKQYQWRFTHEVLREYFGRKALVILPNGIRSALLLSIAARPENRNKQNILCRLLGEDEEMHPLIINMIRANILYQRTAQDDKDQAIMQNMVGGLARSPALRDQLKFLMSPECMSELLQQMSVDQEESSYYFSAQCVSEVKATVPDAFSQQSETILTNLASNTISEIREYQTHYQNLVALIDTVICEDLLSVEDTNKNAFSTWQRIEEVFVSGEAKDSRLIILFQNITLESLGKTSTSLSKFVYGCFKEVPEMHQQRLFNESIGLLIPVSLPSSDDGTVHIYPTVDSRWTHIVETEKYIRFYIQHSISDTVDAIQQYKHQSCTTPRSANEQSKDIVFQFTRGKDTMCEIWGETQCTENNECIPSLLRAISDLSIIANTLSFTRIDKDGLTLDALLLALLKPDNHVEQLLLEQCGGLKHVNVQLVFSAISDIKDEGLCSIADTLVNNNKFHITIGISSVRAEIENLAEEALPNLWMLANSTKYKNHVTIDLKALCTLMQFYPTTRERWTSVLDFNGRIAVDVHHSLADAAKALDQHAEKVGGDKRHEHRDSKLNFRMGLLHTNDKELRVRHLKLQHYWGAPAQDQLEDTDAWLNLLVVISKVLPPSGKKLELHFDKVKNFYLNHLLDALIMKTSDNVDSARSKRKIKDIIISGVDNTDEECKYCKVIIADERQLKKSSSTTVSIRSLSTWASKLINQDHVFIELKNLTFVMDVAEEEDIWSTMQDLAHSVKSKRCIRFTNVTVYHSDGSQSRLQTTEKELGQALHVKDGTIDMRQTGQSLDQSPLTHNSHHQRTNETCDTPMVWIGDDAAPTERDQDLDHINVNYIVENKAEVDAHHAVQDVQECVENYDKQDIAVENKEGEQERSRKRHCCVCS